MTGGILCVKLVICNHDGVSDPALLRIWAFSYKKNRLFLYNIIYIMHYFYITYLVIYLLFLMVYWYISIYVQKFWIEMYLFSIGDKSFLKNFKFTLHLWWWHAVADVSVLLHLCNLHPNVSFMLIQAWLIVSGSRMSLYQHISVSLPLSSHHILTRGGETQLSPPVSPKSLSQALKLILDQNYTMFRFTSVNFCTQKLCLCLKCLNLPLSDETGNELSLSRTTFNLCLK